MNNYIELKEQENKMLEIMEQTNEEISNLFIPLYEESKHHPYIFRVLPRELNTTHYNNLDVRLTLLKEDIELSDLSQEEKNRVYEIINNISERLVTINKRMLVFTKAIDLNIAEEKEKRKAYVLAKKEELKQLNEEYNKYEEIIKRCKEIANEENLPSSVREAASNSVKEYSEKQIYLNFRASKLISNEERELIEKEYKIICEEETGNIEKEDVIVTKENELQEEIQTIEQEQATVNKTNNQSEEESKTILVANNEDKNKTLFKESTKEPKELMIIPKNSNKLAIRENPEPQVKEPAVEKIKPLIPEKPKKVKSVHKANKELISKIIKTGAAAIGIGAIVAGITFLIANPAIVASILGGYLVINELTSPSKSKSK